MYNLKLKSIMNNIISLFFGPKKEQKHIINCIDKNLGKKTSLIELISNLEERIEKLENENIQLTNSLYEVENTLQSQINKINPPIYNLQKYTLGEK